MIPTFSNPQLLVTALTHRSALNERKSTSTSSNERLEFLGDAVLELIVSDYLYTTFPQEAEGVLTAYRSALVKTSTLAEAAIQLSLGPQLFLSRGEEAGGGRENSSLLADTLEAIIGAIYLDQGYTAAQEFVSTTIISKLHTLISGQAYKDAKSGLQELVQSKHLAAPEYTVTSQSGPDHDKRFVVVASIGSKQIGVGEGKSKQQAQQAAAQTALENQKDWLV